MNARLRKTTATVLVVAYVLTGTVSHWFHTHGTSDRHAPNHACARHARDHHDETDHQDDHPGQGLFVLAGGTSHDHCPVCDYLAQKTVPPIPVVEVASAPREEDVSRVAAPWRSETPLGLHLSRAPPSLA